MYVFVIVIGSSFQNDWIVDFVGELVCFFGGFEWIFGVWQDWYFGSNCCIVCFCFVVYVLQGVWRWIDLGDVLFYELFCEFGVFGQEVIVWMYCVGFCDFDCGQDLIDVQVVLCCWGWVDVDCVVSVVNMSVCLVGCVEDCDGFEIQIMIGVQYVQCNFIVIGDQNFVYGLCFVRQDGW